MARIIYYTKPKGKNSVWGTEIRLAKPLTGVSVGNTVKITNGGYYSGEHEIKDISVAKATGAMWLFISKPFKDIGIKNKLGVPIDRTTGGNISLVTGGNGNGTNGDGDTPSSDTGMSNTMKYALYGLVGLILLTVVVVIIKKL